MKNTNKLRRRPVSAIKVKLYAFWKYDLFPHVLGGEVTKLHDNGMVTVRGYGESRFVPRRLVPASLGKPLLEALKFLESEHGAAIRKLDAAFDARLTKLLGGAL